MNANNSIETKSIGSTVDSLFDVIALIKAAASYASLEEEGGDLPRILRIADGKIGSIIFDLDAIDSENKRSMKEKIQQADSISAE